MSAEIFNIRSKNDSIQISTLVELYNKMARYCNPTALEINEDQVSLLLNINPNFWQNTLIFENTQNLIVGFVSIIKYPFFEDEWFVIYGIMPKYLKSNLPGELIYAIWALGKKHNIQELYIETSGELSVRFDDKLEELGFKPIHYYYFMRLDDFDLFYPPDIPQGIVIRNQEEIEDHNGVISVVNKAFNGSFLWKDVKVRKFKKMLEALKKNNVVEYGIAYENNKVIGFCSSYFNPNQEQSAFINTLSIHPSYHHRGIGSALLASRVEFLRDKECKTISLPVDAKNEKALRLYEKFGFYQKKNLTEKTYQLI